MSLITPDFGLIFWMVIIFGALFFLLAKFGFPVITEMVQKRSDHIADSLKAAQEAQQQLASLAEEQKKLIEQAKQQQGTILREASAMRDEIIANAKQQAQEEANKILTNAKDQIAIEKESALRDIRREVALISFGIAEKVVKENLSDNAANLKLMEKLVDDALETRIN